MEKIILKKRSKGNIELILMVLFFIITLSILTKSIYKEIKTPVLTYDEAITYFNDGAKCLGFRTCIWDKDIKDARKVKIEYKGEKFWFYTDFNSGREFWEKYHK